MSPTPWSVARKGLLTTRHRTRLAVACLALALLIGAPAWPAQAAVARVTGVTVKTFPGIVQVAVSATGRLTFTTTTLEAPTRLVVDLPGAVLADGVPAVVEVGQGPVRRVRSGQWQRTPPIVRITVDLAAPTAYAVRADGPGLVVARLAVPRPTAGTRAPAAAAPRQAVAAASGPRLAQAPAQQPPPPAQGGRITLDLRNTEIADVLSALAKLCGFNIVTDASVRGTITVRLVEVTCDEALRFILEANNLGFRRVGRNLIVMSAEKLAPPPEAPEPVVYMLGFANADQARAAVAAAVPGIRVAIDPRTNALVVFGTPSQQEQVQKILQSLDIKIAQILIETRVVDISTTVLRDAGLDWGLTGVPITQIQGVFPNQITVGVSTFDIFGRLTALIRDGRARVITAPRLAVLDGNKGMVNLGEEIPIPQVDAQGRITFTFKPVGVVLEITPRLGRDGIITTQITPEVSSVIEFLQTAAGPVPRLSTRRANTVVQARSGESIVIAGLISAQERRTIVRVPLLGDIPVIGSLFRRTTTDRAETEVIFIITPQVVDPPAPRP